MEKQKNINFYDDHSRNYQYENDESDNLSDYNENDECDKESYYREHY